jgi:hypothetical protein
MNEYTFITEGLALYILYAVIGISIFMMALLGTYAKFRWRVPILAMFFAAFLGLSYFSLGELLGRPKPVQILTWDKPDVTEADVVGMYFRKGEGVYLLLLYEGMRVPRYYQFPWNKSMARQLKRAEQGRRMKENKGIKLKWPFQRTWEDRTFPEVYEIPWPAPPEKGEQLIEQIDLNSIDA